MADHMQLPLFDFLGDATVSGKQGLGYQDEMAAYDHSEEAVAATSELWTYAKI